MSRPIIGIIANPTLVGDDYPTFASGDMNVNAIGHVAECMPVLIPADARLVNAEDLLDRFDGFLFTGGRPNVHPEEYGEQATEAHGEFDRCRDQLTLPLIRACVTRGQPIFGICRGFQEVTVAMGGTLYPEIRDLEGRMNHRMPPDGTLDEKFALRHKVKFETGGVYERLLGDGVVMTNSLHGQGIKDAGPNVVIDGYAPDGTPEAIYVRDAAGFTLAVQWHPEYNAQNDPVSRPLFTAFGDAARAWQQGHQNSELKSA